MMPSEREALVARVRKCADELYGLPGEGQLLRLSPRNAERVAVDLRALVTEVERLTRERDAWRRLVRDDGYAMTFQSLGQYRSAILTALTALEATDGR